MTKPSDAAERLKSLEPCKHEGRKEVGYFLPLTLHADVLAALTPPDGDEVEKVLSQARAQNPYGDNSDEAAVWNEGFCDAWAAVRAILQSQGDQK